MTNRQKLEDLFQSHPRLQSFSFPNTTKKNGTLAYPHKKLRETNATRLRKDLEIVKSKEEEEEKSAQNPVQYATPDQARPLWLLNPTLTLVKPSRQLQGLRQSKKQKESFRFKNLNLTFTITKKDLVLRQDHPSVYLATINRPTPEAKEHAKVAYATLKPTSVKRTMDHFQDHGHDLTATLLLTTIDSLDLSKPTVSHIDCLQDGTDFQLPQDGYPAPTKNEGCTLELKLGPREQLNQLLLSWLDGSAIYYGLTDEDLKALGVFLAAEGDARANEHSGLAATDVHTITALCHFIRQHHLNAEKLVLLHPQWTEETVFDETRKIVIAQVQHISYPEFLPLLLGPTMMKAFGLHQLERGRDHTTTLELLNYFKLREAFEFIEPFLRNKSLEIWEDFDKASGTLSEIVQIFESIYENPFKVDLFPGEMVELPIPIEEGLVRPTYTACIIGQTFRTLGSSDGFWYENPGQLLGNWQQLVYLDWSGTSRSDLREDDHVLYADPAEELSFFSPAEFTDSKNTKFC